MRRPFLLATALLLALCSAIPEELKCTRVRRPVHSLSQDELMLYVDGIQALRANGKYQIMIDAHSQYTEVHRGSSFFFYHTYFVWEVETQIRQLGGRFTCFALPYYDWTIENGREHDPWILNTVFGGNGDPGVNNCVTDPNGLKLWGIDKWPVRELCGPPEDVSLGCCLKRNVDSSQHMSTAKEVKPIIEVPFFHEFLGGVLMEHQRVHWLFAMGDECQSCAMATGYSPDDPIFMLLHSFVAYLRAVWAGCHGYDHIDSFILDNHPDVYTGECIDEFDECGAIELDAPYYFGDMATMDWSLTHKQDITPRSVWNFEAWRVKYDLGTFWEQSDLASSDMCDPENVEASAWFALADEVEAATARLASDAEKEAAGIPIVSSSGSDAKPKPPAKDDAPAKPEDKPPAKDEAAPPAKPEDKPAEPKPKPEDKPKPKDDDKPKPPPKAGRKSAAERRAARAETVRVGPLIEDERVVVVWGAVLLTVVALVLFALSRRTSKSVADGYYNKVEMSTGSYGATQTEC